MAQGKAKAVIKLLSVYDTPPDILKTKTMEGKDIVLLDGWLLLAAKAETINEFRKNWFVI